MRISDLSSDVCSSDLDNRRQWEEHAQRVLERERTGQGPATLVMVELDSFKAVNDVRGHAAGDDVLRSVAVVLRECIGDRGHAVRYGGDEFAVALDVDEPQALEIAASLRRRVG